MEWSQGKKLFYLKARVMLGYGNNSLLFTEIYTIIVKINSFSLLLLHEIPFIHKN